MRALPKPPFASADVLAGCLAATTDQDLFARLLAIVPTLNASAVAYDANATSETLDLLPRVGPVGEVTRDELIALYSTHFSATRGAVRNIYDQLRNAAPHKKCPLCGIGTVAVLDHHLPKAKYPDLSIVPTNLVPACHFCNDTKRARFPMSRGEQTLHPYFDARLIESRWMAATLDQGPPPVLLFAPAPPRCGRKRIVRGSDTTSRCVVLQSHIRRMRTTSFPRLRPAWRCSKGVEAKLPYWPTCRRRRQAMQHGRIPGSCRCMRRLLPTLGLWPEDFIRSPKSTTSPGAAVYLEAVATSSLAPSGPRRDLAYRGPTDAAVGDAVA